MKNSEILALAPLAVLIYLEPISFLIFAGFALLGLTIGYFITK